MFLKDTEQIISYRIGLACLLLIPVMIALGHGIPFDPMTEVMFQVYFPLVLLVSHVTIFRKLRCPVCTKRLGFFLLKNALLFKNRNLELCPKCGQTQNVHGEARMFFGN